MSDNPSVEDRLAQLEKEIAQLKNQVNGDSNDGEKSKWITDLTGQFKNDTDFDEIATLGKEIRDAEQPDYGNETE